METAFAWLGQIFEALLQFVPRRIIIRATEGGVKWSLWREPKEMLPGVRFYWPLITDLEIIVVARQTLNTRTQSLMTQDGREVVAGGVIIYKINDVVQAIGKQNWSPEDTAEDIAQAAIVEVISHWNLNDLLENISGKVEEELTNRCRKQLRQYGVYVHRAALTDFSTVRAINHSGINIEIHNGQLSQM
jgi:regulator of protease activity HflC (stomatin/prohibitin superfamily)